MGSASMPVQDTIFALSSGSGKAGVAIIRISGQTSKSAARLLGYKGDFVDKNAVLTQIFVPGTNEELDKIILLYFEGPRSFTGEDVVELHVHGSRAVIKDTLSALAGIKGLRMAAPGEFSRRAFMNGKMDLTSVEGLADLIEAETSMQRRVAIRQFGGELNRLYEKWRQTIIELLANLEAFIDFPEDDVPKDVIKEVEQKIQKTISEIEAHLDNRVSGEIITRGVRIAIIGAVNAGKSTLINAIAKRDVAIVSQSAGTTRDVIEVSIDLNGFRVTIADTAGLRETADSIEKEGIHRTLKEGQEADIVLFVIDANDRNIDLSYLRNCQSENVIIIFNKADLAKDAQITRVRDIIKSSAQNSRGEIAIISAKNKDGIDRLLLTLSETVEELYSPTREPMITQIRYRTHLQDCLKHLRSFSLDKPLELCSEDVRLAANAIGTITGAIDVEEVLDRIFSSFCIGK